jgi:hypothetical protein
LLSGFLATATPVFVSYQQQQLNANNTVPLDIRPLRMSVRLKCTTQNLNIASNTVAVLIPQSVSLQYGATSGTNSPKISNAAWNSLWQLCESNPKSVSTSNVDAARKAISYVLPPSSFTRYNSYEDWVPLSLTSDNAILTAADWLALNSLSAEPATFPFVIKDTWFGEIPPNYMLLINFEPNPAAQSFEMEVFCQDGVRFPANSLVASMEHRPHGNMLSMEHVSASASSAAQSFSGFSGMG